MTLAQGCKNILGRDATHLPAAGDVEQPVGAITGRNGQIEFLQDGDGRENASGNGPTQVMTSFMPARVKPM